MNWIKEQWDLLGMYSMKFQVCIQAAVCAYFVVYSFYTEDTYETGFMLVTALLFAYMIVTDFTVANYSHLCDKYKGQLADTQDDLCISKHEVERLKLELETTQAALVEAKKPKNHLGYVQTGLAQVESSAIAETAKVATIDVATAEAPLPKPKRRPAPRGIRKPRTKNENKD